LKTIRKSTLALIVIVLIVGIVISTVYLTRRMVTPSFSFAPSTLIAVQGANITFNVYGLESNGMATIYFGDGHEASTTSTLTHAYQDAGRYLVGAEESVGGQSVASTFNALQSIQITAKVNESLAPLISIPTVAFDVNTNPSAPVVRVGDQVHLYGGYLRPPSGTNITIVGYDWDFGNGVTKAVAANSTSLNPVENPATTSYAQSGLYPVTLTLVTENSTSMASFRTSVEQTVVVGSSSQPYALFLYSGVVPNPSVINFAEYGAPALSLDPDLDFESGWEIITQTLSTLLTYNGSSTTDFIPVAASEIPSLSNGGISPDYTSYTFHIRQGLRFSNGDPLTAYDVYYSVVRSLLFRGSPGVGGYGVTDWILAQYLVGTGFSSIVANATDTAAYNSIINSMSYSNASDTITFKLIRPFAPELLFTGLVFAAILDSSWLERIGAGITFTPAGFYAYQNEGNPGNFNLEVQNNAVGSGPYMIQSYTLGQSISLIPNPGFPGIPGLPKANNTVVIQWVKDPETAYNLFRSGQADVVYGLPDEYFPRVNEQVAKGQAKIYLCPVVDETMLGFSAYVGANYYNETAINSYLGTSKYDVPSDYFLNLDVRKAFAYAFNYQYFLDEILGNKKYGVEIGGGYAGAIIQGYAYHVPETELQNVPVYNLTYAKQLLQESGKYDTKVNIPFPIRPYNNQTQLAVAQMLGAALHSIDPNIVITPVAIRNRSDYFTIVWPILMFTWVADYPYPSDVVDVFYQNPYAPDWLNSTGHPDQAAMYAQMNALIAEADSTTNSTLAAQDYKQIEQIAINLYLYVYLDQPNFFYIVKPYMNGYQGQFSYLMNPMGGWPPYVWWVKTCGSIQACSGRGIGP
jgi:peptide/nickel transport system substrate-binding protein